MAFQFDQQTVSDLAPREVERWRSLPPGEKRRYLFPAGEFDFIGARDARIGEFLICSLFSPVLEFADHATARETARRAREALLDPACAEPDAGSQAEPRGASEATPGTPGPLARLAAGLAAPLSRRDLLHGRIGEGPHEPRR